MIALDIMLMLYYLVRTLLNAGLDVVTAMGGPTQAVQVPVTKVQSTQHSSNKVAWSGDCH
jgi:hypothetical protein